MRRENQANKRGAKMNELFIKNGKAIVMDEGHWITINGNHVLINEKGEVMAGMGGKFNGRRISKFQGAPSREDLEKARDKNYENKKAIESELENVKNSKDYKAAERDLKRVDREIKKEANWYRGGESTLARVRPEEYASMTALREQKQSKLGSMLQSGERKLKENKDRSERLWSALRREKNARFTKSTERERELAKHVANAERNRVNREKKVEARANAIAERYNKMAERLQKKADAVGREKYSSEPAWRRNHMFETLAQKTKDRGEKLADMEKEKARAATFWNRRRERQEDENRGELAFREKRNRALTKFLDKNRRQKLANAQKANEFIANAKGTRVSSLTSGMTGGRFIKPKEEAKMAETLASRMERYNDGTDKLAAKHNRKWAALRNRQESAAKQTLAKARPKIAERRQAIRAYNEREDDKLAKSMGLGKYRKPYYETDAFKSGFERHLKGVDDV